MSAYYSIELKFDTAQKPVFAENRGKGFIEFGNRNNYPEYLLELYNESPKHGAIVKGKAKYIYGKGFETGSAQVNTHGENWNQVFKKASLDDQIFSGYYLQVVYNKLGKVKDIFHIPFKKCRKSICGKKVLVKNDWSKTVHKDEIREYPIFDPLHPAPTQIFCYTQYSPDTDVYPVPEYFQALNYIESDIQISRHILGNAKQGFVGSTLINFNNGDPVSEEAKGEIEKKMLQRFTGADGKRVVITFNKSKENAAEIVPLGQTMLTKEDFTNINNLVQQEIFAGHQVTTPALFGIKTEGQLGGRTELRDGYEIFNNTFVNERQQEHEATFTRLSSYTSTPQNFVIIPVEPLGFEFSEAIIAANMSRNEIREKMGLEPDVAEVSGTPQGEMGSLSSISGRQQQNLLRIVRLFNQGKLNKQQAAIQLQSFGFNDEQINMYLGLDDDPATDDQQFSSQDEDTRLLQEFAVAGEPRSGYEFVHSEPATGSLYFAADVDLTKLEANILDLISKDKRITPQVLAKTLNTDLKVVSRVINGLVENNLLNATTITQGADQIIERTLTEPIRKLPGERPTVTEVILRYSYEGPQDDRNRPFCAKLLQLDRVYARADIEAISERLGYSVWDRRGGWLTLPNGEHRPFCRHTWKANIVIRKK